MAINLKGIRLILTALLISFVFTSGSVQLLLEIIISGFNVLGFLRCLHDGNLTFLAKMFDQKLRVYQRLMR